MSVFNISLTDRQQAALVWVAKQKWVHDAHMHVPMNLNRNTLNSLLKKGIINCVYNGALTDVGRRMVAAILAAKSYSADSHEPT